MTEAKPKKNRAEYMRTYYRNNADHISEVRKEKYETNPEYRETVLSRNKKAKRNQRDTVRAKRADSIVPTNIATYRVFEEDEKTYATIGGLAKALEVSEESIRLWEEQKIIPPCQYRSGKGERLYSAKDVIQIKQLLLDAGRWPVKRSSENKNKAKPFLVRFSDGSELVVLLARVSSLARLIGRKVNTVSSWEREGKLPGTPLRKAFHMKDPQQEGVLGTRLYTIEMQLEVQDVLKGYRSLPRVHEWPKIKVEVEARWTRLQILGKDGQPSACIIREVIEEEDIEEPHE